MRKRALVIVSAAVIAAVDAGCYWPVPSCEEASGKKEYKHSDYEMKAEGTSFRLRGELYASCKELCAREAGVIEVNDCEPPELVLLNPSTPNGPKNWKLVCDVRAEECHLPEILEPISFGHGRRPEGFPTSVTRPTTEGEWFAEIARLEAASVPAFERLARELEAHGAPRRLVRMARRSMRDEIVHTRMATALARRHGAKPRFARTGKLPVRSLARVAIENAVEGCVSETLGAVIATYQARTAHDPRIRRAFDRIARDETRHAELALSVFAWAEEILPSHSRSRMRAALHDAVARIDAREIANEDLRVLGLPDVAAAERMIAKMRELLWRPLTQRRGS
jgi:hypothetical protein